MMFGGYETIEAYEDDLYREESSSELSVDSEVEFQLYSQVHYAQDLDNVIKEEEHEEKNSGNSESFNSKPNQKNLIILSDSEVIQLSDGSEVITLSDEDSIYKCKRKNFRVHAEERTQGPPAFRHSNELADKKCKRDIEKTKPGERSGTIQEVMIIEVSSSEEEESTISESDNVESWMLLGCEVDDKDDDILLNLVGCENSLNEGEDGVNWFISDKDIEAQIGKKRTSGRWTHRYYSVNKNVTCRNCDKCGHLSKNCPFPQKVRSCCLCSERGHLQYACPARFCLDCSLPMSSTHRCLERPSWRKRCDRCDMIGHYADACPEIWRQYHLTTKPGPPKKPKTPSGQSALVYCYNCGQEGHYGHVKVSTDQNQAKPLWSILCQTLMQPEMQTWTWCQEALPDWSFQQWDRPPGMQWARGPWRQLFARSSGYSHELGCGMEPEGRREKRPTSPQARSSFSTAN
ncbi:zinc finger CCHC domain-containing protein 7 isoform X2 [Lagenorhynchus albirostris]|uniref:zinc finger CCHC domain-containing protein 7 isoform X2 n=1 Tax=Lagenorhynchus albirostris TaxID=27610 RepID=UPI0028EBDB98|nr:zinc finger CCHC domain-containing protein 7 isoform X2 [Lagenorhynchus albirostris]